MSNETQEPLNLSEDDLRSIALHEYLVNLGRPASTEEIKAAIRVLKEDAPTEALRN